MAKAAKEKSDKKDKGIGYQIADSGKGSGPAAPPPRLQVKYRQEVHAALKAKFGIKNDLAVPRIQKIVVNMGLGKSVENKNRVEHAARDLALISGQKPMITKARKSIAGFKLRMGMPIGVMVTLRRERMYEFLDRLISTAMPRIRDFRGLPRKLDGRGNYSLGLSEQSVFSEIRLDNLEFVQGMQVTIVTSSKNDEQAFELLDQMGLPFQK